MRCIFASTRRIWGNSRIIEQALSKPVLLEEISARSYEIQGFDEEERITGSLIHLGLSIGGASLTTARDEITREVNAHLWDNSDPGDRHRHTRRLGSFVVTGSLTHALSLPADKASGQLVDVYNPIDASRTPLGQTYLRNTGTETVSAGEAHALNLRTIHAVTRKPQEASLMTINTRTQYEQSILQYASLNQPPPYIKTKPIEVTPYLERLQEALDAYS